MLSLPPSSQTRAMVKGQKGANGDSSPNPSLNTIFKDDLSNFTVDKWKNKIFTDPRVRSKLKDRNYRVKIIEDVELTRAGVIKSLPSTLLESLDGVIALGTDTVLFEAKIYTDHNQAPKNRNNEYRSTQPVVLKVWNKPAKQLMESKKPFYEDDLEFVELLNRSPGADFREFWAERELKILERLSQKGIKCPKGIVAVKNVLIMSPEGPSIIEQEYNLEGKHGQHCFNNVLATMQHMYTNCGLVHADLSEKNIMSDGIIYDVYRVVSSRSPGAEDALFKSCNHFFKFVKQLGLKKPDSVESMYFEITGSEFKSKKPTTSKPVDSEKEIRKMERKSERSANNQKIPQ